jgi:hypothetical protein
MIIYDQHVWRPYVIITHDHHIWSSSYIYIYIWAAEFSVLSEYIYIYIYIYIYVHANSHKKCRGDHIWNAFVSPKTRLRPRWGRTESVCVIFPPNKKRLRQRWGRNKVVAFYLFQKKALAAKLETKRWLLPFNFSWGHLQQRSATTRVVFIGSLICYTGTIIFHGRLTHILDGGSIFQDRILTLLNPKSFFANLPVVDHLLNLTRHIHMYMVKWERRHEKMGMGGTHGKKMSIFIQKSLF